MESKLQAEQWKYEKKRKENRDNKKWRTASAKAPNNSHHDNGQDRETDNEAASSISILYKHCHSVVPGQWIIRDFIQRLRLGDKVKVMSRFVGEACEHFLFQHSDARGGSPIWVYSTAKCLQMRKRSWAMIAAASFSFCEDPTLPSHILKKTFKCCSWPHQRWLPSSRTVATNAMLMQQRAICLGTEFRVHHGHRCNPRNLPMPTDDVVTTTVALSAEFQIPFVDAGRTKIRAPFFVLPGTLQYFGGRRMRSTENSC